MHAAMVTSHTLLVKYEYIKPVNRVGATATGISAVGDGVETVSERQVVVEAADMAGRSVRLTVATSGVARHQGSDTVAAHRARSVVHGVVAAARVSETIRARTYEV